MIGQKPDFVDSPYFDPINWRLLPGAPKEVVREFKAYMRAAAALENPPTIEELQERVYAAMNKKKK